MFLTRWSRWAMRFVRTITIRTEPHSVMQTINRQVAHYSYHVGRLYTLRSILRGTSADAHRPEEKVR